MSPSENTSGTIRGDSESHRGTPSDNRRSIVLRRFEHRGSSQISLNFPYDLEVKALVTQLDFVSWTRTHGCFYMGDEAPNVNRLIRHCRGKIWIDLTGLRSRSAGGVDRDRKVDEKREKKGEQRSLVQSMGKRTKSRVTIDPVILQKIDEMRRWMQQKRYSSSTIQTYLSFVTRFFAKNDDVSWDEVTMEKVIEYNHRHFICNKRSHSSQNQWINAIKLYLHVHHLDVGSLTGIERPRKQQRLPNVLSREEVRRIILSTGNMKHKFLLSITYGGGLRIGEVLRLQLDDVRGEERLLYIRDSKGQKDRRVPLSDRMFEMYREYQMAYKPVQYVFNGQGGGVYSQSSAQKVLKRAVSQAGIKIHTTLHTLRHSYATHLMESGVGLRYIQEILGHNSPKTTMIYTHVSGGRLSEVRSPLDDLGI